MKVDTSPSQSLLKVLVVDDDADLRALIAFTLHQVGFEVCTAADGPEALRAFAAQRPDLVLLDVNIPPPNGLDVCAAIRKSSTVPIMMLSVRGQEDDLVAAIDAGADDYVRKPFSPRALIARVRALLRRGASLGPAAVEAGNIHLDLERQTLRIGTGMPLSLTPLEARALQLLVTSPGRTVTAERLLNHVWGRATSRERRTLKQLVYRLRKKLEDDPATPRVLQTTPGAGYKLVAE